MKKYFILLAGLIIASQSLASADFTIAVVPADNSVGSNQISSILSSKISDFAAAVQSLISYNPSVKTGTVSMFAGDVAPDGYLLCQGQSVSRASYPELFAII
jgi:hypothetical protein